MSEIGLGSAAKGDTETGVSVPSGLEQVAETWMQAKKALTLFEPELATKRLFPSIVEHLVVAVVTPAQREKAKPEGLAPVAIRGDGQFGACPQVVINVSAPVLS